MNYTFSPVGITLNQVLLAVGIKTIESNGAKFLEYNGKTIARPNYGNCEQVIFEEFGIKINYTS